MVKYLLICIPSLQIDSAVPLKIAMEEVDCIIIIPVWKSQDWFTKLLSILVDVSLLLSRKANLLNHSLQTDIAYPILSHSHLAAYFLLWKSFKYRLFKGYYRCYHRLLASRHTTSICRVLAEVGCVLRSTT